MFRHEPRRAPVNVTLDLSDDLALITLDDGKKNAITLSAVQAINESLDEAGEKAKGNSPPILRRGDKVRLKINQKINPTEGE